MPQYRDALVLQEQSAPSTPASGFAAIYVKSDGKPYSKDDAGTEYDLTASGGGGGGGSYTATVGNGSATDITVTHSLGTRDVDVIVRDAASPYAFHLVPWDATDTNNVTLHFDTAPATNSRRVVVLSSGGTAGGGSVATDVIWDNKGDLAVGTGADTAAKLALGSGLQVPLVDTSAATGLRYGEPRKGWRTGYSSGEYTTPAVNGTQSITASWGSGQLWAVPFYAPVTFTFDRMRIYQGATGNFRLGVYAADGVNGLPATLILDAGVIAGVGSGDKELTGLSQSLTGGTWYWLALLGDTTMSIAIVQPGGLNVLTPNLPSDGGCTTSHFRVVSYGALPNPFGTSTTGSTSTGPFIQLRVA